MTRHNVHGAIIALVIILIAIALSLGVLTLMDNDGNGEAIQPTTQEATPEVTVLP